MELQDFCNSCLRPTVTCSAISSEGYEICNLISSNPSTKQKGFMAYHIIKPPVDITFQFMCKVNLSHIIIWPQVGCQKSVGFEIWSSCGSGDNVEFISTNPKRCNSGIDYSSDFVKLGSGFINNEPGVVFSAGIVSQDEYPSGFQRLNIFNRRSVICNVKFLRIRILKTSSSSVPALSKVETWGRPSRSCSREIQEEVSRLWNFHTKYKPDTDEKKEEKREVIPSTSVSNDNFEIPEEFIDPITCELMVIPVTLPSGKVIDQTTLEKHIQREEIYGHYPSDPFTGKRFTESSRPVLAASLKARMDKFLLDHADRKELKNVPRTVGRQQYSSGKEMCMSNLVHNQNLKKGGNFEKQKHCANTSTSDTHMDIDSESNALKRMDETNEEVVSKRRKPDDLAQLCETKFEVLLDHCLASDLQATLSNLPKYASASNNEEIPVSDRCCAECKSTEILYHLPCKHLVCRTCLVKEIESDKCGCKICNVTFSSSDPIRCYV